MRPHRLISPLHEISAVLLHSTRAAWHASLSLAGPQPRTARELRLDRSPAAASRSASLGKEVGGPPSYPGGRCAALTVGPTTVSLPRRWYSYSDNSCRPQEKTAFTSTANECGPATRRTCATNGVRQHTDVCSCSDDTTRQSAVSTASRMRADPTVTSRAFPLPAFPYLQRPFHSLVYPSPVPYTYSPRRPVCQLNTRRRCKHARVDPFSSPPMAVFLMSHGETQWPGARQMRVVKDAIVMYQQRVRKLVAPFRKLDIGARVSEQVESLPFSMSVKKRRIEYNCWRVAQPLTRWYKRGQRARGRREVKCCVENRCLQGDSRSRGEEQPRQVKELEPQLHNTHGQAEARPGADSMYEVRGQTKHHLCGATEPSTIQKRRHSFRRTKRHYCLLLYYSNITTNYLSKSATVAERLARSPPTKANRVQSPSGSLDFRQGESCRTMPLVGGFSRGFPVSPAPNPHFNHPHRLSRPRRRLLPTHQSPHRLYALNWFAVFPSSTRLNGTSSGDPVFILHANDDIITLWSTSGRRLRLVWISFSGLRLNQLLSLGNSFPYGPERQVETMDSVIVTYMQHYIKFCRNILSCCMKSYMIIPLRNSLGATVVLLGTHLDEPGFSHVGIVPDDAAGRRVFSGISRFPRHCIHALLHTHLTSPSQALKTQCQEPPKYLSTPYTILSFQI
ncbi:hypothetical protein PR048_003739 [Dryococelus australis]|uniref:Uncharacterized protein n=1 Tax=Dryococelus australis TaxID=614101 RepID=A0ABQ9INW5_9NEOP|nr:hypothetical protein PR048_003739 [Dryococelus australis]